MKKSVVELEMPVRRRDSVSVTDVRSPKDGGLDGEGDAALEYKVSEISGDECKT